MRHSLIYGETHGFTDLLLLLLTARAPSPERNDSMDVWCDDVLLIVVVIWSQKFGSGLCHSLRREAHFRQKILHHLHRRRRSSVVGRRQTVEDLHPYRVSGFISKLYLWERFATAPVLFSPGRNKMSTTELEGDRWKGSIGAACRQPVSVIVYYDS